MTNPYDAADPHRGLDPAGDPDRFVPDAAVPPAPVGPLDPALDPDRFVPDAAGDPSGKDLTELIGKERSFEEERNPYTWVLGLVAVVAFLAVVSVVMANLSPR